MVVNPDDILIFKLRGMHAPEKESVTSKEVEMVLQSKANGKGKRKPAGAKTVAGTAEPTSGEIAEFYKQQQVEEAAIKLELEEEATKHVKLSKTEESSKKSAKGFSCVNHPWRAAYAVCNYCKRPFCFADLVDYDGKFFCLEDVDKVANKQHAEVEALIKPNIFSESSGIFFIINALVLAYFQLPQFSYMLDNIATNGIAFFLLNINYIYGITIVNFLLIFAGIAAGILSFSKLPRDLYASTALGGIILIVTTYEYLNTSVAYMLAITALAFISVGSLAYGRLNQVPVSKLSEVQPEVVNWPKLETF